MTSVMQHSQVGDRLWLLGHKMGHVTDLFQVINKCLFRFFNVKKVLNRLSFTVLLFWGGNYVGSHLDEYPKDSVPNSEHSCS